MSAYTALEQKFSRRSSLSGAIAMLHWDSAVIMPDGGSAARSEQLATLGVLAHEMLTDPSIGDLLDRAETDLADLDDWQRANLREMRNGWRHATAVDADLVEAHSHATSACEMQWRAAREDNYFVSLIPALEEASGLKEGMDFGFLYSPEFIALGSVIHDMLNPDFCLIGESLNFNCWGQMLQGLYKQLAVLR